MAHTQVLLREDIDKLGARGEIVRVKTGYARNYLLPRKLAVEATANNVRQIEGERAALLKREAKERSTATAQADQLRNLAFQTSAIAHQFGDRCVGRSLGHGQ